MNAPKQVNASNLYLYNKKELQQEFTQYDYGARFYDPVIARWATIDPLAETSRRFSPYAYVENNSLRNIDVDGMWAVTYNWDTGFYDQGYNKDVGSEAAEQQFDPHNPTNVDLSNLTGSDPGQKSDYNTYMVDNLTAAPGVNATINITTHYAKASQGGNNTGGPWLWGLVGSTQNVRGGWELETDDGNYLDRYSLSGYQTQTHG